MDGAKAHPWPRFLATGNDFGCLGGLQSGQMAWPPIKKNMHCIILAHATKFAEGELLLGRGAVWRDSRRKMTIFWAPSGFMLRR
ncbi:hypothetical protein GFL39_16810 [Rhizobium leguminosarum bv. viciae]|nr:hypothetical protein [Rhizobium leguminosarum bv. viciae]NKL06569.1 hypothetical protein [Rhizobium leguminosarum bv. viciae]NKL84712.1 hypothetical protein [Rhizobium leguminosarum bv. viciae]NKL92691.1 hypothetical protein [Rhizobium leguminosarum bv. viciae]NKM91975.1 hypothetical protein [Rhizobium leguminosarum bv. viciae]